MSDIGKLLEAKFPDSKAKMTYKPIDGMAAYRKVRLDGEDAASIPWVNPESVLALNDIMALRRDGIFDMRKPADRKEYQELCIRSAQKEFHEEAASYRQFELTNDVMASPFALGAFAVTNLNPDELPAITKPRSRNMQRFTVREQSIDGGAREAQWRTTKDMTQYELGVIATDKVEYPTLDIQQGDINQSAAVNVELKYDMDMKLDGLALANIQAAQTASGLRALLSFHPLVDTTNIPDTNYYDLNALFPGNLGVLTLPKLKAILNHMAMMSSVGGITDGLTIQTVMCSPQNLRDAWDFTDLVSGVGSAVEGQQPKDLVPESVRDQIFNTGVMTSAWGYNWSYTPNSQIPKGRLYIFMNQPLGWMFTKTSMDRVFVWNESNSIDHAESNMGEVMYRRVLSFLVPDLWKHRILIIDL